MQDAYKTPVVSQSRSTGWTTVILAAIINGALIIFFIIIFALHYKDFSWVELSGGVIALAIWMYYAFNATISLIIKLTVGPGGIEVLYPVTKRKWKINYADIIHVESVIANGNSDRTDASTFLRLEITLRDGQQFTFTDAQFANYHELKDAIRFFRFQGNEAASVSE
jgi:hypothetical protein